MNMKTTQQIKKHNDSAGKLWLEVSDFHTSLNKIITYIQDVGEDSELKQKEVEKEFEQRPKEEIEEAKKLRELSQRVSNLQQSNEAKGKKLDRIYGEIVQANKHLKEDSDKLWEFLRENNDRLKVLEEGNKIFFPGGE